MDDLKNKRRQGKSNTGVWPSGKCYPVKTNEDGQANMDRYHILPLDLNHQLFGPYDLEILWMTSKTKGHLFYITSSFFSFWSYSLEMLNLGKNMLYFVTSDLEIWKMTLQNNRAPLLWYFKLCALFCGHQCIQTGVTVQKWPNWVKIGVFCPV